MAQITQTSAIDFQSIKPCKNRVKADDFEGKYKQMIKLYKMIPMKVNSIGNELSHSP